MDSHLPFISVIIPVYNGERYLAEAIESVLAQTYKSYDILVIDDGSIDNSAAVARSFGSLVRYYFHDHAGLGATRNLGIELSKGNYLAFLDADDVWSQNKLSLQMKAFENSLNLDMVFGLVQQFISPELDESIHQKIYCPPETMTGLCCSTMIIKRDSFLRVGMFDDSWKIGEFIAWYANAIEQGLKGYMLPEVVMKRRLHTTNMGIRDSRYRGDYVRVLKALLDRRRASSQQSDNY